MTLPADYDFGDNFSSQDIRLTKTFGLPQNSKVAVFVEVFNIFNVANLGGYSFNLSNTANFGQPFENVPSHFANSCALLAQIN